MTNTSEAGTSDTGASGAGQSTAQAGRPPIVDLAAWQAARDELLIREKAHTREGDAIAAARRRLPMVEFDGSVKVVGPDGPVSFLDLFQGRDELITYKHMWWDGTPHQGQCEGCTVAAWHLQATEAYLNARGVSLALVTVGAWDEVAPFVEFMGYTSPWYSVLGVEGPAGGDMGYVTSYLRDGDRVFMTYSSTGRGTEVMSGSFALLDMTPYGRGESWQDMPEGWPAGKHACWYWRTDVDGNGTWEGTGRPAPQWTRPGVTPETTLGRQGSH